MTPPTQEEELFKEAAWKEFPGLMTIFIKNDESRKLRIFNLKEESISVYDNSDQAEKQQVDNRVLHEAFLRGAMYAHNLAQQEIERVKREYWNAARAKEMFNANDPGGSRAAFYSDYPIGMRPIGWAHGERIKWKSFDDYEQSKQAEGVE